MVKKKIQRKECIECAHKLELDLKERIKELECLYIVSSQIESGKSLGQILENSAANLIKGFQYPEMACAAIVLDQVQYSVRDAPPAEKAKSALQADIVVNGQSRGYVKVGYVKEMPLP